MKKTARVIVTLACNRKCPGCCNETIGKVASIGDISVLSDYEEVVITGGEPMLNPDSLLRFIKALKKQNKRQRVYLYTACLSMDDYGKILNQLDGITVTLHAEATDDDIRNLKYMSHNLYGEDLDMRCSSTVEYMKNMIYQYRLKTWDVVRKRNGKRSVIRRTMRICFCSICFKENTMENYKVVSITDREGNPRTDGRYPDRVGRICTKPNVRIGEQMVIQWISNADGTPYVGELTTSMAISYIEIKGKITVTTRHSVYTFEKL